MALRPDNRLHAGPIEVDPARREVRFDGRPIALTGLPYNILQELIQAQGRVVTRAELKQRLWPYAERIDTERRLNTAVRGLREALHDGGSQPRLIQTVRGYGYRWIAFERQRSPNHGLWQVAAAMALVLVSAAPSVLDGQLGETNQEPVPASALASTRQLAWTYVNRGRPDAAMPHIATLIEAGDRSPAGQADLGWLLLRSGTPAAALAACSEPKMSLNLLSCRQTALGRLGLTAQARDVGLEIMRAAKADPKLIGSIAGASPNVGYARFLSWRVGAFVRPDRDWFQRAQLQAEAGMYREALASLQRAAATHDPLLVKIASSAEFAPLRGTAGYRRIAAKALGEPRLS